MISPVAQSTVASLNEVRPYVSTIYPVLGTFVEKTLGFGFSELAHVWILSVLDETKTIFAGPQGIEPRSTRLERVILPLK